MTRIPPIPPTSSSGRADDPLSPVTVTYTPTSADKLFTFLDSFNRTAPSGVTTPPNYIDQILQSKYLSAKYPNKSLYQIWNNGHGDLRELALVLNRHAVPNVGLGLFALQITKDQFPVDKNGNPTNPIFTAESAKAYFDYLHQIYLMDDEKLGRSRPRCKSPRR